MISTRDDNGSETGWSRIGGLALELTEEGEEDRLAWGGARTGPAEISALLSVQARLHRFDPVR